MKQYLGALAISATAFMVGFVVGTLVSGNLNKPSQFYEFDSEVIVVDIGR